MCAEDCTSWCPGKQGPTIHETPPSCILILFFFLTDRIVTCMFKKKHLERSEERIDLRDACKTISEQSGLFNSGPNAALRKNGSVSPAATRLLR